MAFLEARNISVDIPIWEGNARSLRSRLTNFGRFKAENTKPSKNDAPIVAHVLENIDLSLISGDRLGIVGANGAGKSTLLRVLAGIFHPTSGSVTRIGKTVPLLNIALGMDENSTGRQNIRLRGYFLNLSPAFIVETENAIAEFSELGDYLDMPIRTYSTGMRMRLAFSISMAVHTDILLLDEVLAVGDVAFQEKALRKLQEVCDHSGIVVMALHSGKSIMDSCNKALWLDQGKTKMFGPSHDVVRAYDDFMHGRKER